MLGESFIHVLNYREEAIDSPDITCTSFSSADCVLEPSTFAQFKDTPSSLEPGQDVRPMQKLSKSKAPHHRPDLYVSNQDEKPYVSLSQPEESNTILDNLPLDPTSSLEPGPDVRPMQKLSKSKAPHHRPDLYVSNQDEKPYVSLSQPEESNTILDNLPLDPQLNSITESQQVYLHFSKPQEWHITDLVNSIPQQLHFIPESVPLKHNDIRDDGYLVMDNSIMLNGEPPTNSMLNGYLDKKLQEVYSQYLQERLACPGSSPGCSLLSHFHQTSLLQLSQPLNMDSSLESETRQSQGAFSQRASSNFSSPVLRISNAKEPIRPRHSEYVSGREKVVS